MERRGLRFEHFVWKWSKIAVQKKLVFCWFCRTKHVENHASRWMRGYIANFGISLVVFEFLRFWWFFTFFKKFGFWGILDPPYRSIGATIRIGREMLCLPYILWVVENYQIGSDISKSAQIVTGLSELQSCFGHL